MQLRGRPPLFLRGTKDESLKTFRREKWWDDDNPETLKWFNFFLESRGGGSCRQKDYRLHRSLSDDGVSLRESDWSSHHIICQDLFLINPPPHPFKPLFWRKMLSNRWKFLKIAVCLLSRCAPWIFSLLTCHVSFHRCLTVTSRSETVCQDKSSVILPSIYSIFLDFLLIEGHWKKKKEKEMRGLPSLLLRSVCEEESEELRVRRWHSLPSSSILTKMEVEGGSPLREYSSGDGRMMMMSRVVTPTTGYLHACLFSLGETWSWLQEWCVLDTKEHSWIC